MAGSHFRTLVKRGEGAKTLRVAILGLPAAILSTKQLIVGASFCEDR